MPTEEYKPLLDRRRAIESAEPLAKAACPLLREVVNHASWVFRRCDAASDAHGAENEDLAAFTLYRHLIELTDGIEVLFASSCVDAAVPAIRAAFEASLSLDFMLRDDYTRRALAWTCSYLHGRISVHERLDSRTKAGEQFDETFKKEMGGAGLRVYDADPSISALQNVLARDQFREINAEYLKLRKQLNRAPDWFRLVGVKNRRALARIVGRESEYLSFYAEWSGFSHATDAASYITAGQREREVAFLGVRSPGDMPHRAFFVVYWLLSATRQMIEHFRAGENLTSWYLREIQAPFFALQRLRVVLTDDGDTNVRPSDGEDSEAI
jgi:hypothetical protein